VVLTKRDIIIYDIPNIYSIEIPKYLLKNTSNLNDALINYYKNIEISRLIKFDDLGYDKV